MAIAIDGAGGSSAPAGASSATFSVAVGSGSYRYLIAAPAWYTVGGIGTVLDVFFNTTEQLTEISGSLVNDAPSVGSADRQSTALYGLVAPSNATANLVIRWNASYLSVSGGAVPWTGVNQSAPVGTPQTNSSQNDTTPSVTVTGVSGEVIFGAAAGVATGAVSTSDTQVWYQANGGIGTFTVGAYQAASGGADTIDWSGGLATFGFVASGVAIKPVGAGGSDTPITPTVGGITLAGVAARNDRGLIGSLGALTLTGVAGSTVHSTMLTSVVGALVLTGVASSPVQGRMITTQVGHLTIPEISTFTVDHHAEILVNGYDIIFDAVTAVRSARATVGRSLGDLYSEFVFSSGSSNDYFIGIGNISASLSAFYSSTNGWGYWANSGQKITNFTLAAYGNTWTNGDVIGVRLAFNTAGIGTLTFYKNGVSQGVAYNNIPAGTYYVMVASGEASTATFNFGDSAITFPVGSSAWTVQNNPKMDFGQILTTGSLTLTGFAPTFPGGTSITPDVGAILVTGVAPRLDLTIIGAAGAILLSGVAPYTDYKLTTIVGALTLLGYTVTQNLGIIGSVGSLSLTGVASSPVQGLVLTPQSGSASITGIVGRMDRGIILSVGSLSIVGGISTIQLVMSNTPITPSAGVLAIVGGSPEAVVFLSPEATSIFIISRKTNTWILDRKTNQLVI